MTTSEQAALLAKHQPYPPNKLPLAGGMQNCRGCSEGRGMAGGIGWPCDVYRMAELKDAEIAQAVDEAVGALDDLVRKFLSAHGGGGDYVRALEEFRPVLLRSLQSQPNTEGGEDA